MTECWRQCVAGSFSEQMVYRIASDKRWYKSNILNTNAIFSGWIVMLFGCRKCGVKVTFLSITSELQVPLSEQIFHRIASDNVV